MALFVATASISSDSEFLVRCGGSRIFHMCLDKGINDWILTAEKSGLGMTVVDISVSDITDNRLFITISYRAAQPSNIDLQGLIIRAITEGGKTDA